MDSSKSIGEKTYYQLQDFSKYLVRHLNVGPDIRVAFETYNNNPEVRFDLNDYNTKRQVIDAMSYRHMGGQTNTAEALRTMANTVYGGSADRAGVRNIGILLSDGHSADRADTFSAAVQVHEDDITVLGVGVNVKGEYARRELHGITSDPDSSNFVETDTPSDMDGIAQDLLTLVCNSKFKLEPPLPIILLFCVFLLTDLIPNFELNRR